MVSAATAALLQPLRNSPQRSAVLTDFDGTLAPIVDDPYGARPLDGAVDALRRLARRYGVVAVISGRPVSFLLDRFGDTGSVVLNGLYGLEWIGSDGARHEHAEAGPWRSLIDAAADDAEAAAPVGTIVERKGLSVVLHVRTAPEHDEWARGWAEATADATGLALHPGRRSYELRPQVATDKGTVVDELVDGVERACFLGDDVGDLPAFDALDRLGAVAARTAVRIGVISPEAPVELVERADVMVDGPVGALDVLRWLLDA
jgi:trehalose 6-phosphate phosphatase